MKTRTAILLLTLTLFGLSRARADLQAEFCSYYDGKCYRFTITSEQQARCPKWNPDESENPPLSAAKALSVAKKFISGVKTENGYTWELQGVSLVDVYGWAWRAQWVFTSSAGYEGPLVEMQCLILMDGTVVKPIITPYKAGHVYGSPMVQPLKVRQQ